MLELCLATDYTDTSQAKSIDLSVDLCPSVAKEKTCKRFITYRFNQFTWFLPPGYIPGIDHDVSRL